MRKMKRLAGACLSLLLLFALMLPSCAAGEESGFADTASDAWYAEAVHFCRERGLMNGISDTRFAPEGTLTRAQLVTVLYRMEASPAVTGDDAFTDTAAGQWYSAAVVWASQRGLVNGYGDGRFGPNDAVTQEQLALIFQRYTQFPVTQEIPGFDGSRTPATRAQTAAALMACVLGNQQPSDPAPAGGRILVAYFSCTNNTKNIAESLQSILNADLCPIIPAQPYTSADLNYNISDSRANREQNDASARPAISGGVEDMEQYDVIFLGYPIWWGQAPKIMYTFLESYDLSGKTIVPFCTSGSSGLGSSASALHALAPNAKWLEGERFSGSASRDSVERWVNSLDLSSADGTQAEEGALSMNVTINGTTLTASLADNASARAFRDLLSQGPRTIKMNDYGGMEKVGPLGTTLPASDQQITTQPGDIILYQGDQVTIYYDRNSWNFTRLGKLEGIEAQALRTLLGSGSVEVTFSLD